MNIKPGQRIRFRRPINDEEWKRFRETCGLIRGEDNTALLLLQTAEFQRESTSMECCLCRFDDDGVWWIPNWLIISKILTTQEEVLAKIKYLDQRYAKREKHGPKDCIQKG